MATQPLSEATLSLQWREPLLTDSKCLDGLITAFALSVISLIGGIISFTGVMGIGTAASGTWVALSSVLSLGLFLLMIECKSACSGQRESISVSSFPSFPTDESERVYYPVLNHSHMVEEVPVYTENPSLSEPEREHVATPGNLDAFSTPEEFARLTSAQVRSLMDAEIVRSGHHHLLSPRHVRELFTRVDKRECFREGVLSALRPDQLAQLDPNELRRYVEHLTPYQVVNLVKHVQEASLANALLHQHNELITSNHVNKWLETGIRLDPNLLGPIHISGLFRDGFFAIEQDFLTPDLSRRLDSRQVEYLLRVTEFELPHVDPVVIGWQLSEEQANRLFPNPETYGRIHRLHQVVLNNLILSDWTGEALKALSAEQIRLLPFNSITDEQLTCIFPTDNREDFRQNGERMRGIPLETLQRLLYIRELNGDWLMFISRAQIQSLSFGDLDTGQIKSMLPTHRDQIAWARERYEWLSPQQKRSVPTKTRSALETV